MLDIVFLVTNTLFLIFELILKKEIYMLNCFWKKWGWLMIWELKKIYNSQNLPQTCCVWLNISRVNSVAFPLTGFPKIARNLH